MQNSTCFLPSTFPDLLFCLYCADKCHHPADQVWESVLTTPDLHCSSQVVWIYGSKYPFSFKKNRHCCFGFFIKKNYSSLRVGQGFPADPDPDPDSGKESAANARDSGSIPGSGRSPGEGNGTDSRILAWKILWTEEPGRL